MFRTTLLAAVALAAYTSAQALNYSESGPLTINVSQVDPVLRQTWCTAQTSSCPNICGGRAMPNSCDATTLEYNCTCANGNTPNISDYQQTIPSFVCQTWVANCVDFHPNDLDGQAACLSVQCGNKTSQAATASSSSSSISAAAPTNTGATGSSNEPSATSATASGTSPASTTNAAIALNIAQNYGSGILLTGALAIFGLAL